MRLAYMIIAHTDPAQLARLVRALDEDADFFILVDLKADDAPFRAQLAACRHLHWTTPRISVRWGSYSQVEAQLANLRAVLASGVRYDKVFSLSGQDYPLHSNKRIRDMVERTRGWQLIKAYNVTQGQSDMNRFKIDRWHTLSRAAPHKPFFQLKNLWYRALNKAGALLRRKKLYAESGGVRYDICFGCDYWAVDHDCAAYVTETMMREDRLRRFLRHCYAPVELYIHTIIYAPHSPYRDKTLWRLQTEYPLLGYLYSITLYQYSAETRPFTETNYGDIVEADRIFFRKVVSGDSDELVALVDARRAEEEKQTRFPPPFSREAYTDTAFK